MLARFCFDMSIIDSYIVIYLLALSQEVCAYRQLTVDGEMPAQAYGSSNTGNRQQPLQLGRTRGFTNAIDPHQIYFLTDSSEV
jgi:hypothetical protein